MRKEEFADGEFYHIFNRGVDKREIFVDTSDSQRFFQSMSEFNSVTPIGSIYENSFSKSNKNDFIPNPKDKLVNFTCYCLNPNHYHFLLQQVVDKGIEKFMHKLGLGYAKYFNNKHHRSGALFQGSFKSVHVNSNEYLLHLSAYINLNYKVHNLELGHSVSKLGVPKSSFEEYVGSGDINEKNFCDKEIILGQFKNSKEYEIFANSSVEETIRRRKEDSVLDSLLIE